MSSLTLDQQTLKELEDASVRLSTGASLILKEYVPGNVEVKYKDEGCTNPVTEIDLRIEDYLRNEISKEFASHAVLGEEHDRGLNDRSDFVWVLDPLDGTSNFAAGLLMYSISIGLLFKGIPVVGSIFSPSTLTEGATFHARSGGGAFIDDNHVSVSGISEPSNAGLIGVPAGYRNSQFFKKHMNGIKGNIRITGSITHEMLMVASGVFQLSIFGRPRIWDVAAGTVIIKEAGGEVLRNNNRVWEPLDSFSGKKGNSGEGTLRGLRNWGFPLLVGNEALLYYVTHKPEQKNSTSFSDRVQSALSKLTGNKRIV